MDRKTKALGTSALISLIIFTLTLIILSQSASALNSVQIYSDAKNINLCNFNITSYHLYLYNPTYTAQVVQIKAVGSGARFLTFSNDLVLLKPNETENVTVFLNPNNELGVYSAKLEFIVNDVVIKELDQTFNFKACKTFNFTISPLFACYGKQANLQVLVGNERASILNLKIRFNGKTYEDTLAPYEQKMLIVPTLYKKLGNFSEKIIIEDETTGYKQTGLVNVNVSPCGQNITSFWKITIDKFHSTIKAPITVFMSLNITTKTYNWRIHLIVFLVVLIILLTALLILRYREEKKHKDEHKVKEEPAVEVIQAEPGVGVQEAQAENKEESKENKSESRVETIEISKLLKAKRSSKKAPKRTKTSQEILSKEPYYKSVINRMKKNHFQCLKIGLKVMLITLIIVLLIAFIRFGARTLSHRAINQSINTTSNATRNMTNAGNATSATNSSMHRFLSHVKNLTARTGKGVSIAVHKLKLGTLSCLKDAVAFIKEYKVYFIIGIIISIILILYCNQKGYPCWGEKIPRVKEIEVKPKSNHKPRKSRKRSKKTKKSKK